MCALPLRTGVWVWDDILEALSFQKKDLDTQKQKLQPTASHMSTESRTKNMLESEVRMCDTVDSYGQAKFRRHYQRKVKFNEKNVVTVQDIKDVAIYTCKPGTLSLEFISYFHTETMDIFLRSLIVYFHYYIQTWNKMQLRRIEAARKLRQPVVTVLEDIVSDNLSDLRGMVARNYAAILLGMGDAKQFHHMNNQNHNSMSDKDRKLFEMLCFMLIKFVWIALFRKNFHLIEKEIHRILRTDIFNPLEHVGYSLTQFRATTDEERVLLGKAFANECRLLHRSPAIQEILFKDHDYRLMAIGICQINTDDKRIQYLEAAYSAPEELLLDLEVGVGILGIERKFLDPILKPQEISTTEKRYSIMEVFDFELPPRDERKDTVNELVMEKPSKYQETAATKSARRKQCRQWRGFVVSGGFSITSVAQPAKLYK